VDRPAADTLLQNSSKKEDIQDKDLEKGKNLLREDNLPGLFSNVGELLMPGKRGVAHRSLKPEDEGPCNAKDEKNERNNGDRIVESDRTAMTSYADQTLGWEDTDRSSQSIVSEVALFAGLFVSKVGEAMRGHLDRNSVLHHL
jgi:hypothetical protein